MATARSACFRLVAVPDQLHSSFAGSSQFATRSIAEFMIAAKSSAMTA